MDDTDSNQEAKADSSSEETSSFEWYAFSRKLFESDSEEDVYPEYESFIRPRTLEDDYFIAARFTLPAGSTSFPCSHLQF